jgi:membrane protein DedA with SNARE-associated domain
VTSLLTDYGLAAVFVLMAIDAVFPAASEAVMVYGGALASGALTHQLEVFGWEVTGFGAYLAVVAAGVLGYQLGAVGGWWLGRRGGHPFLERRGRLVHLGPERAARAERWFDRWGSWAVLLGRLTPIARSFVSIPAGLFESPFGRYNLLTLIGNGIWCLFFAAIGWALGASWDTFDHDFRFVDVAVVAIVVLAVAVLLLRRLRRGAAATINRS